MAKSNPEMRGSRATSVSAVERARALGLGVVFKSDQPAPKGDS